MNSLKNSFSISFVNRIDNILVFNRLEEADIRKIINIKLEKIKEKYSSIAINYADGLIDEIVNKCDFYEFGARRLDKIIVKNIENVIIDAIINNCSSVDIISLERKEKNITIF